MKRWTGIRLTHKQGWYTKNYSTSTEVLNLSMVLIEGRHCYYVFCSVCHAKTKKKKLSVFFRIRICLSIKCELRIRTIHCY